MDKNIICEISGCKKLAVSRFKGRGKWLCSTHYKQVYRHGSIRKEEWIHGDSKTKFYKHWTSMINRCDHDKTYIKNEVKICKRWRNFRNFKEDMFSSYNKHVNKNTDTDTTLERNNNSFGYNPSNCRWATKNEQGRNTSKCLKITFGNKTMNLSDWGRYLGIDHVAVTYRLKNWPVEKALSIKGRTKGTSLNNNKTINE